MTAGGESIEKRLGLVSLIDSSLMLFSCLYGFTSVIWMGRETDRPKWSFFSLSLSQFRLIVLVMGNRWMSVGLRERAALLGLISKKEIPKQDFDELFHLWRIDSKKREGERGRHSVCVWEIEKDGENWEQEWYLDEMRKATVILIQNQKDVT